MFENGPISLTRHITRGTLHCIYAITVHLPMEPYNAFTRLHCMTLYPARHLTRGIWPCMYAWDLTQSLPVGPYTASTCGT